MIRPFAVHSVSFRLLTLSLLSFVFLSIGAWAQTETGAVTGTVRDSTGALLTGAQVNVKNLSTDAERTTTTNNVGQYTVLGLEPGKYQINITKQGFTSFQAQADVTVGGRLILDAQLTVGSANTVVEVVAGGTTEVNTQTQELSQLIDAKQLNVLPSLTRNPYDFVALSGNVSAGDNTTNDVNSSQNSTSRGVGVSINGQRQSGTEILLDGVENVAVFGASIGTQIPVDGVQEYRVITNNFDSEYGRASGGVVNLTTKSGTNNFHGTLWEYNRLSSYTANTYANDAANANFLQNGGTGALPAPKGQYTRNQFGFAIGGPLIKNKIFFFGTNEWTRVRSNSQQTQEILDPSFVSTLPANIQSYFSAFGGGAAPASGVITAGQLAGATNGVTVFATGTTNPLPASTPVLDTINFKAPFDAGGGVPQNTYRLVARMDFNLTDKTQMYLRYGKEHSNQFEGSTSYSAYPQYNVGNALLNDTALLSLSHTFNSDLLTSSKLSFSRLNNPSTFNAALTSTPNLILNNFATDPSTGIPIQLPGLENTAAGLGGLPAGGPQNTIQLEQDLAWTKGRHSMRFGGQFTYIQLNYAYGAYAQAVELLGNTLQQGFNGLVNAGDNPGGSPLVQFSARVNPDGALPCPINQFGAYPNPVPAFCTVQPPLGPANYSRSYRYKDWAAYAQDSFRITPRLTLNYGLRYEHYGVQHNVDPNQDANFYYGSGSTYPETVRTGQVLLAPKSPVGGLWAPDWGTAAPRLGFAYDIFGDGKTSLRGGFGVSYERNFGNVTFNASFNPPLSAVLNVFCSGNSQGVVSSCGATATNSPTGVLGVPGPPTFLPNVELRHLAQNIDTAQTQFWSLALERELARNTVLAVEYNGAHGVHLYDIFASNLIGGGQAYLGDQFLTSSSLNPNGVCNNTGYVDPYATALAAQANPKNPPTIFACYTRPNAQYAGINTRGSHGSSAYNSLNLKFQTQNLHNTGLSLVSNYTWSHALDDISSTFSDSLQGASGAVGNLGYTDPLNPKLDWGSSDIDIRQRFVLSPIWETPWYKGQNSFTGHALGGWSISGIFTARTGIPFSVYDYTWDLNGLIVPRLVPAAPITDWQAGSPKAVGPNQFHVLTVPLPANIGPFNKTLGISDFGPFPSNMISRNSFRAPGAWNLDLAVAKGIKLTERVGLEFRAEGFDLFNHHNYYINTGTMYDGFGQTLTNINALKGGLGSAALGGNHDERRFGQFAMKVSF